MNDALDVTTRSRRPVWPALILVTIAALVLAALVYRGDALRRQSAAQLVQQAEVARKVHEAPPPPAGWDQVAQAPAGLDQPIAIASGGGRVYVVGTTVSMRDTLLILTESLAQVAAISLPGAPRAVTISRDRLAVAFGGRVALLDLAGKYLSDFPVDGDRARLSGLVFVGQELWAADSGNRIVWRLRRDGSVIGQIGARDEATGYPGLLVPSPHLDLALTPQGNVFVNNPGKLRIETWSPQGKLLSQFGKASNALDGFCGCCNPIAVAVLPDGRIVTGEKGLVRVKTYRPDGSFEGLVAAAPPLSRGGDALDLATDADGRVLVLDPRARMIRVFEERKATSPAQTVTSKDQHAD